MINLTLDTVLKSLQEIGQFIVWIALGVAALEILLYFLLYRLFPTKNALAYMLLAPALIGIAFLIIYPFAFEVYLAFTDMSLMTARNPTFSLQNGIDNFRAVFTGTVAHKASFWQVLWRTVLWTIINVVFHVSGGMVLALLLNRPMRLRGLYRTLLVFPWAIPQPIAAMSLRNQFNFLYGFFNVIIRAINKPLLAAAEAWVAIPLIGPLFDWLSRTIIPVSWLQDPTMAFVAVCISNIWLGIPFMSVIILGGLQSISREYYEAAEMDGASGWNQFRSITLPLLNPVLTPAVVLGTVWTFNNLNVIYLITRGGPQERTDILVTSLYKAAFQFYRYGFSAAFALVIFVFLLAFALIYIRVSGGLKTAYE